MAKESPAVTTKPNGSIAGAKSAGGSTGNRTMPNSAPKGPAGPGSAAYEPGAFGGAEDEPGSGKRKKKGSTYKEKPVKSIKELRERANGAPKDY